MLYTNTTEYRLVLVCQLDRLMSLKAKQLVGGTVKPMYAVPSAMLVGITRRMDVPPFVWTAKGILDDMVHLIVVTSKANRSSPIKLRHIFRIAWPSLSRVLFPLSDYPLASGLSEAITIGINLC